MKKDVLLDRDLFNYKIGELNALKKQDLVFLIISTRHNSLEKLEEKYKQMYKKDIDFLIKEINRIWYHKRLT